MEMKTERTTKKRQHIFKKRYFQAVYPEYFGFDPNYKLIFVKTPKGYKAVINSGAYIGMPRYLIENNTHLFLEITKK